MNRQDQTNADRERAELVRRFREWKPKRGIHLPSFRDAVRMARNVLILAGIVYGALWLFSPGLLSQIQNNIIYRLPVSVPATFNNDPPLHTIKTSAGGECSSCLESDPIVVRAGVDAVAATQEEVMNFEDQTPPVHEWPADGSHSPYLSVIFPADPSGAIRVQVVKETFQDSSGLQDHQYYYLDASDIYLMGDAPFSIPLVEGAKKVAARIETDPENSSAIVGIDLEYQLSDGRQVTGYMSFGGSSLALTDIGKSIPVSVVGVGSSPQSGSVKEFDLSRDWSIPLFRPIGITTVHLTFGADQRDILREGLSPLYETENGKLLYVGAAH